MQFEKKQKGREREESGEVNLKLGEVIRRMGNWKDTCVCCGLWGRKQVEEGLEVGGNSFRTTRKGSAAAKMTMSYV